MHPDSMPIAIIESEITRAHYAGAPVDEHAGRSTLINFVSRRLPFSINCRALWVDYGFESPPALTAPHLRIAKQREANMKSRVTPHA